MAVRNYPRLPIEVFGRQLIESEDLDPLYVALNSCRRQGRMSRNHLKRWMLAYWTFYHAGVASYISDADCSEAYWERWNAAAVNEVESPIGSRWPRGSERRHMRGAAAISCWKDLRERYPLEPTRFVDHVVGDEETRTCEQVMERVGSHSQFGPWIGFKVADMLERIMGYPIDFSLSTVFFFRDPKKAALRYAKETFPDWKPTEKEAVDWASKTLLEKFSDMMAPPARDRKIGLQEVETVLCKWKSHLNGHYVVGWDTNEIKDGLADWALVSPTSVTLWDTMP